MCNRISGSMVVFFLLLAMSLFSETDARNDRDPEFSTEQRRRVTLATSSQFYPVTPGDVYEIGFMYNSNQILEVVIQSDFDVELGVMGSFSARGMLLRDLRREIQRRIERSYPGTRSTVQLRLAGMFSVQVRGEVETAFLQECWGLTRLSTVLSGRLTDLASIREIEIISDGGVSRRYDLFLAQRHGDLTQDPLLGPGDQIVVHRRSRQVFINGEVARPGYYQLLPDDTLEQVIDYYGGGLLPTANPNEIAVSRQITGSKTPGERIYLQHEAAGAFLPEDLDRIEVGGLDRLKPLIHIEGAVKSLSVLSNAENGNANGNDIALNNSSGRLSVQRHPGTRVSSLLKDITNVFTDFSDLERSYIRRGDQKIKIDINALLYTDSDSADDPVLENGDRLVIPFMRIYVSGEVDSSYEYEVWGLQRLSSILDERLTRHASIRDIEVRDSSGKSMRYDLFRARRFGEEEQDPLVRPGEQVIVHQLTREVRIEGLVKRPGTYQLLPGDQLIALVDYYGGGLEPLANISDIRVTRRISPETGQGQELYLSLEDAHFELKHLDEVMIDSLERMRPFVFIEGAVGRDLDAHGRETTPEASHRLELQIRPDTRLSSIVRSIEHLLTDVSDLENAYVIRGLRRLPVNLRCYLYEEGLCDDMVMQAHDCLVIPFRQMFISVGGAVAAPGRYPYIQDRGWHYYAMLAGGIDRDRNSFNSVSVFRSDGSRKSPDDSLEPEDSIFVRSDSPIHVLIRTGQIIAPLASTAALILSLINMR